MLLGRILGSHGDPGGVGEVVQCGAVGPVGCFDGAVVRVGELGQAGGQESVVDGGEEVGGAQPVVGDVVAVAVRDPFDQFVGA